MNVAMDNAWVRGEILPGQLEVQSNPTVTDLKDFFSVIGGLLVLPIYEKKKSWGSFQAADPQKILDFFKGLFTW